VCAATVADERWLTLAVYFAGEDPQVEPQRDAAS